MKKSVCLYSLLLSVLICSQSYGQEEIEAALEKIDIFQGFKGRRLYVYEDVDQIQINPNFSEVSGNAFSLSSIPEGYIRDSDKLSYCNGIGQNSLVLDGYPNLQSFISSNFYLLYGDLEAGSARKISSNYSEADSQFPHVDDNDGQDPGSSGKYYFGIGDKAYKSTLSNGSISSIVSALPPSGKSCNIAHNICSYNCDHSEYDGDNISVIYGPTIKGTILNACETIDAKVYNELYAMIIFRDRTPPRIIRPENEPGYTYGVDVENRFPVLGFGTDENDKITTGDWFKFDRLRVTDNGSSNVKVKIFLGKIDSLPDSLSRWTDSERWDSLPSQILELNENNDKKPFLKEMAALPNNCFGFMRYTVFSQEQISENNLGNLNPGCATIVENNPENCYGFPSTDDRYLDLNRDPGSAKPWIYNNDNNNGDANPEIFDIDDINKVNAEIRVKGQEGVIKISDNDFPNILIRLTSKKDNKQIFFPPCMKPSKLDFDDPTNLTGDDRPSEIYNSFVNSADVYEQCIYDNIIENSETIKKKPYYTIFELKSFDFTDNSIKNQLNRFKYNSDIEFVNKHFRLEDQIVSDTNDFGEPDNRIDDENNIDLIGKRNGTWAEVVALIGASPDTGIIIQEDVEYDLDIWVDDSVRWANTESERSSFDEDFNARCIPTGIKSGEVKIKIPNQSPSIDRSIPLPKYNYSVKKNINQIDRIVFREPTKNVNLDQIKTESDLISLRLPSISVEAEDYAGNRRKIRLYFYVTDENANVRTIQRKHGKH